ncbi:Protein big brother [Araneus ventricosus]|uniref:Protein big brother n=1 Tax=Araneus ventricosus TaxID=182803 RepID=A0A4Y2BG34_ARAVE|nr:Protein big brother [Araneus ventricosus]
MLPFESVSRFLVNMPRVVVDQKAKFESDDLFKKLSRESEVRYTGHKDRPMDERRLKFKAACREGYTEIVSTRQNKIFSTIISGVEDLLERTNLGDYRQAVTHPRWSRCRPFCHRRPSKARGHH